MRRLFPLYVITLIFFCLSIGSARAAGVSGLPIPRFVSLKSDEVNIRSGPGTRYPIQWVYRRQGMPVEVIEEYDVWRKIRDVEGTVGWVHNSMIDGTRNIIVTGSTPHVVRLDADPQSKPILKVEPDVVARIVECLREWCRIQVSGRKGWLEKKHLWGVYSDEIFD